MLRLTTIGRVQRQRLDAYSAVLVILGVAIIWFYLNDIRLNIEISIMLLYAGVALCSTAITLAFLDVVKKGKATLFSTLFLFILSYGLLTIYSFRYDAFGNWDVIGEYVIASKTAVSGNWPWMDFFMGSMDRPGRYASCLSVTVLPATLSKVTGMDMLTIFRFVMPIIGTFVPIVLFLLVREIFGNEKFAFLTAVLFAISHLFIFSVTSQFREQIGFFFMLLSAYVFVKFREKPLMTLIPLSGVVLADAGHVASSLTFVVLMGFTVAPFLSLDVKKILRRQTLKQCLYPALFLVYYSVLTYIWLSILAPSKLTNIGTRTITMIPEVLTHLPEYIVQVIKTGRIFPQGSSASGALLDSPVLRYWYYLQVLLIVTGLLFSLFRFWGKPKGLAWTISGFMVLLIFAITVLAPWYLPELDAGRTIGAPLLTPFLAGPLWLLWRAHSHNRRVFFLVVPFLMFLFLSLPLNMSIVDSSRILHYTLEGDMDPLIRADYPDTGYRDLKFAGWIKNYVPEEKGIIVDFRGFLVTYLAYHVEHSYAGSPSFNFTTSDFLILPDYYADHDLWITPYRSYAPKNASTSEVIASGNVVYHNGRELFIARLPNH